jgi:hypothetical protein
LSASNDGVKPLPCGGQNLNDEKMVGVGRDAHQFSNDYKSSNVMERKFCAKQGIAAIIVKMKTILEERLLSLISINAQTI